MEHNQVGVGGHKLPAESAKERKFLENILATIPHCLLVLDQDLRIKGANDCFYRTFCKSPEEVIGRKITKILPEARKKLGTELTQLLGTENILENLELPYYSEKLGQKIFSVKTRRLAIEKKCLLLALEDITKHKDKKQHIENLTSLIWSILDVNQRIVQESDLQTFIQDACKSLQQIHDYINVEISLPDDAGNIIPMANSGVYNLRVWKITPAGKGEAPKCIKHCLQTKKSVIVEDSESFCIECEYHKDNNRIIIIPIMQKDQMIGFMSAVLLPEHKISKEEISLLEKTADFIGFARGKYLADEALRESEKKFKSLFEGASDPILVADQKTRILVDCNNEALKITGYSKKEILSMKADDLHPKEVVKDTMEGFKKQAQGKLKIKDSILLTKDKKKIEVSISTTPMRIGSRDLMVGIFRDITKRKQAEEELRKAELLKAAILSSMTELVAYHDKEHKVIWANKAAGESIGLDLEQLAGRYCYKIWQQRTEPCIGCPVDKAIETGQLQEAEMTTPDGRTWFIRGNPVRDANGNIIGGIETTLEITDRKQALEALRQSEVQKRAILDASIDRIILIDRDMRIIWANKTTTKEFGVIPEKIRGETCYNLLTGRDTPCPECPAVKAIKSGGIEHALIQNSISKTKKEESYWDDYAVPIKNDVGEVLQLLLISRNITEQVLAEQEKKRLESQFLQAQKMESIGNLAGGIAHDFNNLLTTILGNTELMLADIPKDDPLRTDLEEIMAAGERAATLTRHLLAFSRKQVLQPEVMNLNDIAFDMENMLRRLIDENIELKTVLAPGLGRVEADKSQIEQVIMNLVVNARDALPEGGKIIIETKNVYLDDTYTWDHIAVKPGHYVMLGVSDTGMGMTKAVQAQIFEPFFSTKKKGKGAGLGLPTVYGIIKQSKGNIWVYSEPGKGTTFKIYLPRVEKSVSGTEAKQKDVDVFTGSETVLVVEDDEQVRKLAVRSLKGYGYRVLAASNGDEAIERASKRPESIHLLVTDVVIPGISSKEMVKRLKSSRPEMKVLYISGYTGNAIDHYVIKDPDVAFLSKPFTPAVLGRKVREVLET
ncbi:MAG: PAS domain S-box protein [Candidatus Aminicenantes bacterium]|nr:PAS domain S-box protein [Candidatus Aminicenantes bacterium]